jgi:TPR repeat protein
MLVAHQVLASCYLDGLGVEKNLDLAIGLLEKAANAGRVSAWADLVHLFRDQRHVAVDVSRALVYASALADAGYPQMKMALRAETLGTSLDKLPN